MDGTLKGLLEFTARLPSNSGQPGRSLEGAVTKLGCTNRRGLGGRMALQARG